MEEFAGKFASLSLLTTTYLGVRLDDCLSSCPVRLLSVCPKEPICLLSQFVCLRVWCFLPY
jgi:hypothetical protein